MLTKDDEYIMIVHGTLGRKFIRWLSKRCDVFEVNKVCDHAIRYGVYNDTKRYSDKKVIENLKYSRPYVIRFELNEDMKTVLLLAGINLEKYINDMWCPIYISHNAPYGRKNMRKYYGAANRKDLCIAILAYWSHSHPRCFPHDIIYYHDRKKGVENGNMD